ncbi:MAG: LPP20 family lipoprotein [Campylobacterales bacterium]|nr:LPP20 family lipoprotein [Campylobacterales bacterium]
MKYSMILVALLSFSGVNADEKVEQPHEIRNTTINIECPAGECSTPSNSMTQLEVPSRDTNTLDKNERMIISVIGQGVAPTDTLSPAQAYAMAKRAATADAYRLIAEKVKGVKVEGQDLIKNMMVQRSSIRTSVAAMIRNANLVETTFKEGLCEVEMEITLYHSDFMQ